MIAEKLYILLTVPGVKICHSCFLFLLSFLPPPLSLSLSFCLSGIPSIHPSHPYPTCFSVLHTLSLALLHSHPPIPPAHPFPLCLSRPSIALSATVPLSLSVVCSLTPLHPHSTSKVAGILNTIFIYIYIYI